MRLGEALSRVRQVQPHFFNSFYRRVRVVRDAPRPMPTAATVDVTHRCSLSCPFCIAADVLDQREMSRETFEALATELEGIGRLTLIGGEPFQHPELAALVDAARRAADEVEIFTNGVALGGDPDAAPGLLTKRLPDASGEWLVLALSVDAAHAAQMPEGRLARIVDGALAIERAGLARARFSVTHESLVTGAYIDSDTVSRAIAEVSPTLSEIFMERLLAGTAQESFYFNSVVCAHPPPSGSGTTVHGFAEAGPEVLRLEDLLLSPEVAISFDGGGAPVVLSSLASMWSKAPPARTVLGTPDEAGERLIAWATAGPAPEPALPEWRALAARSNPADPAAAGRLRRALEAYQALASWDGGARFAESLSARVLDLVRAGTGDRVVRWGGEEGGGAVDSLTLAGIVRGLLEEPARAEALATDLAASLRAWFTAPDGGPASPVFLGARELMGMRVPLAAGETRPVVRAHLPGEAGFGREDEEVVRPVLEIAPGGAVRLALPGIEPGPGDDAAGAARRVLSMLALVCGEAFVERLRPALPEALRDTPVEAGAVVPPPADDLCEAFALATWDRNRQRPDEDNPELLALLLASAGKRFTKAAVDAFASRALTWLERFARRAPLPEGVAATLGALELEGREGKRLARLLARAGRPPVSA